MAARKRTARTTHSARTTTGNETRLVVYVHGIGTQPEKERLKLEWDLALFGQGRGELTRMAHWADILHPPGPGSKGTRSATAQGDAKADDRVDVDRALEQAGVSPKGEEAQLLARELMRTMGVAGDARGGAQKKILPLPGFLRKPIARAFLEALIGDTAAYFFKRDIRDRIRRRWRASETGLSKPRNGGASKARAPRAPSPASAAASRAPRKNWRNSFQRRNMPTRASTRCGASWRRA